MKLRFGSIAIIVVALLYFVSNKLFIAASDLEGRYSLHSDGNCHFLRYDSDTLLLKNDGSVMSENFKGNAKYKYDEKQIEISFSFGAEAMTFPIERNLSGDIKLRICMDQNTYYIKIK